MDGQVITTIAVAIPVLGFLWTIHRDVSGLRVRMARVEGLIEGLAGRGTSAKNLGAGARYQISEPRASAG